MCKSCTYTHIMQEIALFSRIIYTVGKNFTRPPVVTVATNLNSGGEGSLTHHIQHKDGNQQIRHGRHGQQIDGSIRLEILIYFST